MDALVRRAAGRGRRASARRAVRRGVPRGHPQAGARATARTPRSIARRSSSRHADGGAQAAGQRRGGAAAHAGWRRSRLDPHDRGHHLARAARGAAADLREDGVDRPARGRRRARGQHAADGHLQLHADAARAGRPRRSADASCSRRSSGRPSAPRRSSTACSTCRVPSQVRDGPVDLHVVINDVLSLLEHQFRTASIQVRKDLQPTRPMRARRRAQAAAGVPEPVPQRARRDAEGRLAVGRDAPRRTTRWSWW